MTATRDDAPVTNTGALVKTTINLHPHRTPPVRLSLSLRRYLASQFTYEALYQLAWMKQHECPGMIARSRLSDASVEELAELLTSGGKPTIGFWRRHSEVAA